MLIYGYFNKEIYINWCFVDVMKINKQTNKQTYTSYNSKFDISKEIFCKEIFTDKEVTVIWGHTKI